MNKSVFKTVVYTALICLIVFGAISIFFRILPYLILTGIVIWIVVKIYGLFNSKKISAARENKFTATTNKEEKDNNDGVDTSEAIDVDFKDVD